MKNKIFFWFTYMIICSLGLSSCNDDDDNLKGDNSPIIISQIYLEDYKSAVPDRPIDFARLGQLIRIEGSGFMGLKKVYINGYDTYFNVAYVTNNSMLVNILTKTPVIEAKAEERNTIRLVKTGVETIYPFIIRSEAPSVRSVSNTLPLAGEKVTVYGEGLFETVKVTLPGDVIVTEIENDVDGEWYSFIMPAGVSEGGSIFSEGANGPAATPGYFNYKNCMILDFDNDENGMQDFWGWSETGSMINKDDLADDPLFSGRGKCLQIVPDRLLETGIPFGKSRATECWTKGTGDETADWSRMYAFIPEETSLTDIAFQFDVYVPDAWSNTGQIQICLMNNFNFLGVGSDDDGQRTAFFVPYINDGKMVPFRTESWQTVTIPFSEFGAYAKALGDSETIDPTFRTIVEDRLAATYQNFGMGFVNTDFTLQGINIESTLFNQKIYIDNWRIVPCAKISVSDFNDEEENDTENDIE